MLIHSDLAYWLLSPFRLSVSVRTSFHDSVKKLKIAQVPDLIQEPHYRIRFLSEQRMFPVQHSPLLYIVSYTQGHAVGGMSKLSFAYLADRFHNL